MQDRELYARILGITDPWQVGRADLKLEIGEVHIVLDHAPDLLWCQGTWYPEVLGETKIYDPA